MNTKQKQNKKRKVNSNQQGLLNLSCELDSSVFNSLVSISNEINVDIDSLIKSAIESYLNGFIKPTK